jgi:TRAP-type uncharacterized transport system substrate-binding protein
MRSFLGGFALAAAALAVALPQAVNAQSRVTLKSASAESSYYLMTVQLAEMVRKQSGGEVLPPVEESQGSVQSYYWP